ncbi:acyl-CoA dehydrogenase family protein [Shewanella sp. GXUN23E]|uniref:acyl-CoA dehydrogenase family protein n=1 Tax=Shewanella sp. GXUN23E TaxID=3422498 RepID=UPI003D7E8270
MEFAFTQEQLMIRDVADTFLQALSPSARIREAMALPAGFIGSDWQKIADEMCWPALTIPETYGGLGLGFVEQAIIMEQMGRYLCCSPLFASQALATNALLHCALPEQQAQWLPLLASGQHTATLGWLSADSLGNRQWGAASVQARFIRTAEGYVLSGQWQQVIGGHASDLLILAARDGNTDALQLFIVPPDTQGVKTRWTPSLDQTRSLATICADKVHLPLSACLGQQPCQAAALESILALARIALAAEQTGGAAQCLQMTLEYIKDRHQFGRAIASFQAVKHRAADMKLEVESAISALYYAACIADGWREGTESNTTLQLASSLAKSTCSETFSLCAQEALQLHGGVGFTWEYDIHLYLKRAQTSKQMLGSPALHRSRIAGYLLDNACAQQGA